MEDVRKRFAAAVTAYGEKHGATMTAMAQKADVRRDHLSGIVHGHKALSMLVFARVVHHLGLDANGIINGTSR